MAFLEVRDIDVFYEQFQALFGVGISVEEGETVAIVGANGAGKSTLMRAISGVLSVRRGSISMGSRDVHNRPAYAMNALGVAMVPEGRRIFPSLSVEDNLVLGGFTGRKGYWTLERVYELFPELIERRHHSGLDLSGGEQQMVAIGRALMSNPRLVLMDEISLGLAPIVVAQIYGVLKKIGRQGTTILLVEQDVSRGLEAADQVYCLLAGKVSMSAKPRNVTEEQIMQAYFGL